MKYLIFIFIIFYFWQLLFVSETSTPLKSKESSTESPMILSSLVSTVPAYVPQANPDYFVITLSQEPPVRPARWIIRPVLDMNSLNAELASLCTQMENEVVEPRYLVTGHGQGFYEILKPAPVKSEQASPLESGVGSTVVNQVKRFKERIEKGLTRVIGTKVGANYKHGQIRLDIDTPGGARLHVMSDSLELKRKIRF
jgi:hypothetical protein